MAVLPLYGKYSYYSGPLGDAKKDSMKNLSASRFDTMIFHDENQYMMPANDKAGKLILQLNYNYRLTRDMATDALNPREELPKDLVAMQLIGVPDLLNKPMINIATPMDYEAHDQVKLVQNAILHHMEQSELYNDTKLFDRDDLNTDKIGKGSKGITQRQLFSFDGSHAGRISNFLDDDGYRMNSIESHAPF